MFTNEYVAVKLFFFVLRKVMHVEGWGVGQTVSSLSFSSDLVGGVQAGLTDQEKRETMHSLWDGGERKIIF